VIVCFKGGNCSFDVMFSLVLVSIFFRNLSTLFWFFFCIGYVSVVIDDTDDDGVNVIVFGCEMLLGTWSIFAFHDDCSLFSLYD